MKNYHLAGNLIRRLILPFASRSVVLIAILFASFHVDAQYYYKDILTPRQTMEQLKKYKENKIRLISVMSYESSGERTEDFSGTQTISDNFTKIKTQFQTALAGESELTTLFNGQGRLVKTIDTTDGSGSVSEYIYNVQGLVTSIVNVSTSPGQRKEKEEHAWYYDVNGKPSRMLRIKNDTDTSFINFILDENGNVAEEHASRKSTAQASYYYYYDTANRVTDIVTYNQRANRLLPVYIFEYNDAGMTSSMLLVPEGSDDYQKWYYSYDERLLKLKETCFNKRKQLLGRIEFEYGK